MKKKYLLLILSLCYSALMATDIRNDESSFFTESNSENKYYRLMTINPVTSTFNSTIHNIEILSAGSNNNYKTSMTLYLRVSSNAIENVNYKIDSEGLHNQKVRVYKTTNNQIIILVRANSAYCHFGYKMKTVYETNINLNMTTGTATSVNPDGLPYILYQEILPLTNTPNIGLGTNSPQSMLHLKAEQPNIGQNNLLIVEEGDLRMFTNNNTSLDMGSNIYFDDIETNYQWTTGGLIWRYFNSTNNNFEEYASIKNGFGIEQSPNNYNSLHGLSFNVLGKKNAMYIQYNTGKVGIGTTLKDESSQNWRNSLLDNEPYKLYVKGGIRTEEVKIDGAATNNWGDFVFEKDYDLMTLEQLKFYVEENKHLPGIPSASQVLNEGFELGEMLRLQMIKIEELFMYIFELSEENKNLRLEIENLKEGK